MKTLNLSVKNILLLLTQITLCMLLAGCPVETPDWMEIDNNTQMDIQSSGEVPPDVEDIILNISGLEFFPTEGDSFIIPLPEDQQINLVKIDPAIIKAIFDFLLGFGDYSGIRFIVGDGSGNSGSYVSFSDGSTAPIYISPEDALAFLVNDSFFVGSDGEHNFTFDFNLQDALSQLNDGSGAYSFTPDITLIDHTLAGTLQGEVDSILVTSDNCAVYLYLGVDATVDESGSATPPYQAVPISWNEDTGAYMYKLELLKASDYTLAYTCEAANDSREAIENINISNGVNVTVNDAEITTLNFFLGTSS